MSRRRSFSTTFVRSRGGRAALHGLCLLRGRNVRWHLGGIVRELFGHGIQPVDADSRKLPSSTATLHALGLAGFICIIGGVPAIATPPEFTLLPHAQVDSSGVFLHQVIRPEAGNTTTNPVRLASAPPFGRLLTLTRDQIAAALQTADPALAPISWTGADAVRVIRRGRILAEGELKDQLSATLQAEVVKDRGELELRLARPWVAVNVPDETLTLKILDLPSAGVSQHFIVRFELVAGDEHLGPWQVVAQAKVMKEILVAGTSARRGQTLDTADLVLERRDILPLREPLDASDLHNSRLELIETVTAGQPVLGRSVRPRPVVQRGMFVDGLIRDGSIQISLKVEVMADGLPGQMVRVRNPKTKREFHAKVQDEQTVLINL